MGEFALILVPHITLLVVKTIHLPTYMCKYTHAHTLRHEPKTTEGSAKSPQAS